MDLPRVRVHPELGVALQVRADGSWWVALPSTGRPDLEVTDAFVHAAGWRELDVADPEEPEMLDIVDGGGRLQQRILDPACADPYVLRAAYNTRLWYRRLDESRAVDYPPETTPTGCTACGRPSVRAETYLDGPSGAGRLFLHEEPRPGEFRPTDSCWVPRPESFVRMHVELDEPVTRGSSNPRS